LADDGATLLVSSHVMDEADRCDELVLIRDGRILAQSPPEELLRRTRAADLEDAFLVLIEGTS
jgi:ABC-2 type transport system ATP-binding protein